MDFRWQMPALQVMGRPQRETRSMARKKIEFSRTLRPRPQRPPTPEKKSLSSTPSTTRAHSLVIEPSSNPPTPPKPKLPEGPRVGAAKRKPLNPVKSIREFPYGIHPCWRCAHY